MTGITSREDQTESFDCPFCGESIKRYEAHLPTCEAAP